MPIPKITHIDERDFENLSKWLIEIDMFNSINDTYPDYDQAKDLKKYADAFLEQLNGNCNNLYIWHKLYEIQVLLSIRTNDIKQADFYIQEIFSMLSPNSRLDAIGSRKAFKSIVVLDFLRDRIAFLLSNGWSESKIYKYYKIS